MAKQEATTAKAPEAEKPKAEATESVPPTPSDDFVPHHEDPFLSLAECGLLVGRTRQTIRKWVDDGLINAIRDPGGYRLVRKSELVRFYSATALAQKVPIGGASCCELNKATVNG